ncbi:hypothetical protein T03_9714 [Trichinella britovi]|uniref:Uncharacterized protein n=1 Tax=Trichinella britovi TaxID=45882 RepID=A0A0V0YYD2_TRIBR|nr:hypothetical protein T03_9714 [Trichinella britovi]
MGRLKNEKLDLWPVDTHNVNEVQFGSRLDGRCDRVPESEP